jgi:anti-anti-sigma factor
MSVTNDNRDLTVAITIREIDLTTAQDFDAELTAATTSARERGVDRLILDFGDVHFLDSGGVSQLIDARNRMLETGCRLELNHVQRPVEKVFDVLGLKTTFAFP